MDNLTHALVGVLVAKTRLGARLPHATLAAALAANLPDIDIVAQLYGGGDAYLTDHRGLTHALVGVLALVPLAAGLHWLCVRRAGARFRDALLLAFVTLASHPALDALNSYGIRPFLPFDATWYYGDVVFIVDPWLWLLLGAGVALVGPSSRSGNVALALVGLGTTLALGFYTRDALWTGGWLAALVVLGLARARGFATARPRVVLATTAALASGYVACLACASRSARLEGTEWLARELGPRETRVDDAANPGPLDPRDWRVFVMTQEFVHVVDWRLGRGASAYRRLDRGTDDPLTHRAFAADCTAAWRSFARFPHVARVPSDAGAGAAAGAALHLMDARYQFEPGAFSHVPDARGDEPIWSERVVRFDAAGEIVGCDD